MTWSRELKTAQQAAQNAASLLQGFDGARVDVTQKRDASPLTEADKQANDMIISRIRQDFPDDGILSEETTDDLSRLETKRCWIIDPLDGTRDFVSGSPDYAVHVALVEAGRPVVAAVACPLGDTLFYATDTGGAFCQSFSKPETTQRLAVSQATQGPVGVSKTSSSPALSHFVKHYSGQSRKIGASIKMLAVAQGELVGSVCVTATEKEWDTCAPGLIVLEAGGQVSDVDGKPFVYNQADVLHQRGIVMSNGAVHTSLCSLGREAMDER